MATGQARAIAAMGEILALEELWYEKIPSASHLTEMLALICSASLR
jgi:hypothetical protein